MAISAGDLRCRMEVLQRVKEQNDFGETRYQLVPYDPPKKIWARIVPRSGARKQVEGDMEQMEITHKVECRRAALPKLTADLRLRYLGQDYDVLYAYPNHKRSGFVELYVRLVVEDGINGF